MKLTKIAAVLITTISLSNTAFSADKPNLGDITWGGGMEVQPGDTGWPSDLPMWGGGQPLEPNDPGYQRPIDIINSVSDVADKAYDQAQINKDNIDKNTDAIENTDKKLAETDGKVAANTQAIENTDKKLAETDGKVAANTQAIENTDKKLAETDGKVAANTQAIENTDKKLDSSLEEQKKVNTLVGNALASNENYWQQQWATNENYAASINQNKSDIAKNRQDINKLNSRVDRLDQKVDDLNDTMKRGFASQAALNGLFQPYGVGKLNATMALGGYESKTAIAAGTGYRFDENTAVKAGIATNTDDFKGVTYNVGVNFEW
ncbi:YadA-like family protein [Moellerella wisconsensis]|uniref:YadA C-terminal domain-containing protein n=1 Tax=Moellerella wisconsensis TaxID=158849 RepID=UPI001F4EDBFC|nr:YadA C-terminal domain-containing protein [Moellerella wisconsensis]UNH27885.1 YadA-like family protein [Moellerella wisconsensis]